MLGIMAKMRHLFFFFLSCVALLFCAALQPPFPLFGSLCMDSMRVFMRLHAESWSRRLTAEACYHSAHPPPPWYFCPSPPPKPPYLFLRVCYCSILFTTTPPLIFFPPFPLWEEHRTRVRRLPSSHLRGLSHSQRETRPGVQTHSQTHAQCLVSLLDLHTSLSSSLIHRHTAGLLESLRWGSRGTPLSLCRRFYWFLDLIPAARLFRDENTSTWTLLDASQAPQTPLPLSPFTPGLKFLGAKPDFSHRAVWNSRNAPLTGNFSRWYFLTLIPDSSPFSRK